MKTELQQAKPFFQPEDELYLSIIRTADILSRQVNDALKEKGLSHAQYNVLRILRGAGGEGLPCGEIAGRMVTRDPDVTRLLDRLEQHGYIARARAQADRRVVEARITPRGMEILEALEQPVHDLHKRQLGFLNGDLEQMLDRLTRIRANCARLHPASNHAG